MRETGKLDYIEMPATDGALDSVKAFYANAFSWTFTDYGASYSAFSEGLDGGFYGSPLEGTEKLFIRTSWRRRSSAWRKQAAASSSRSSRSRAGGGFTSPIRQGMNWRCGARNRAGGWLAAYPHPQSLPSRGREASFVPGAKVEANRATPTSPSPLRGGIEGGVAYAKADKKQL